jgi:hypothetical protein
MTLNDFWPPVDDDHTGKCLITEAETAANEVFLAVHQPMRLTREFFNVQKTQPEVQTERQVLDALLVEAPPSGTLVLPIVGDSGVGKSHLIRWLDAHLRLRADANRRHVVRIPKSSSLRGVLELILKDLPEKRYAELHQKLNSARVPPSRSEAMYMLQARLLFALEEAGKEAKQRQLEQKPRPDDRSRAAHCSPQGLMALLQDPTIQSYFTTHEGEPENWGVLTRIADRCVNGSRKNDAGPLNQFLASDLQFIADVSDASLSKVTKQYLPQLKKPAMLQEAIGFLNEVVDQALAGLVDFGGISLADIFIDIRKAMLADDVELVLLVEDFAVLAGIQGPLLDVMIREAIRDGKRELCTMRTALAVTEGKLPETVKTRAQAMWKIDSQPFHSEGEALEIFENYVGGYLNAARWGATNLRKFFLERNADNTSLSDWVPGFHEAHRQELSEEDNEQLNAFGFSPRGKHPLFPLNSGAVRQLAQRYLRVGESYRFDPRLLINRLVRDTIVNHRTLWDQGTFPPGDFHKFEFNALDVDVSTHLRSKTSEADRKRVAALIFYWGDDPRSPGEAAAMNCRIYEAFRLKPVDWQAKPQIRIKPQEPRIDDRHEPPEISPEVPDALGRWRDVLDDWRQMGRLSQRDANALRQFLADALTSWLDLDALLLKKAVIPTAAIYLPKVDQGLRVTGNAITIAASDEDLNDDKKSDFFFASMRALVRYHSARTWDYEGGESDAARYAALIGRMAKQAGQWFAKCGSGLPAEAVKPLAQALLIGARLLNLEGATSNVNTANIAAMLNPGPADSNDPMDASNKWTTAKRKAMRARADMRTALLEQVSARQGAASEQAVDVTRLLEAISELRDNAWQLSKELDLDIFKNLSATAKEHLREFRNALPGIVAARLSEVQQWRIEVVEALGNDFDTKAIVQTMRDTITESLRTNVYRWTGGTVETLRSRIHDLGPVKDTLQLIDRASREGADFGMALSTLAQLDETCMMRVKQLISDYGRFLRETFSVVEEQLKDAPPSLDEVATTLDAEFEKLGHHWTQITES